MDVKHQRYIITVADEGNITKAAEKLFISQSSLSYVITTVEKELETPLFIRSKAGVTLTPAGQLYVQACREMVKIHDRVYEEIRGMNGEITIRIGSSSVWGSQFFAEAVPKFRKLHPNVRFSLIQTEMFYLERDLRAGVFDFAFISLSPYDTLAKNMQILRKEDLLFAVPSDHPYAALNPGDVIPLEHLFRYFSDDTMVVSRPGSSNRMTVDHFFQAYDFQPKRITEVNNVPLTREMVQQKEGVGFIPRSGMTDTDQIHWYRTDPWMYRYNILISKPARNRKPVENAFYNFVVSAFS